MPKTRQHVDWNSPLFNQVMRNVPVLPPKLQAYVSRTVRDTSLQSMTGVPHDEDEGEKSKLQQIEEDERTGPVQLDQQGTEADDKAFVHTNIKKRKLYRQITGTEVPWFPHDNSPDLLKEFCWEAGNPRWVFHGTPAGGAGMHGCFEMGCSVVALCYDEHHREHLNQFLLQRAVEAMVAGTTMVFKDDILQARSTELNLKKEEKKAKKEDKKEKKEQGGEGEEKDEHKKKAEKKKKKGDKKTQEKKPKEKAAPKPESSTSSSSAASESSADESEPSRKKHKKSKA